MAEEQNRLLQCCNVPRICHSRLDDVTRSWPPRLPGIDNSRPDGDPDRGRISQHADNAVRLLRMTKIPY